MTRNIEFKEQDYKEVSPDDLHAAIKTQLGDKFYGVSTSAESYVFAEDGVTILETIPARVVLHFDDTITGSDISRARMAYEEHDITTLPPKPIVKSDKQRIDDLEALVATLMSGAPPK